MFIMLPVYHENSYTIKKKNLLPMFLKIWHFCEKIYMSRQKEGEIGTVATRKLVFIKLILHKA